MCLLWQWNVRVNSTLIDWKVWNEFQIMIITVRRRCWHNFSKTSIYSTKSLVIKKKNIYKLMKVDWQSRHKIQYIKTIKKILKQNDFISFLCRHKRLCVRLYMAKETRNSSTGTITWTGNSIWAIVCYLIWLWHSVISFHAHTTSNKNNNNNMHAYWPR